MVGALVASALFLVCYLVYHYVHGDTKFTGVGAIRTVYFVILVSHILLSAVAFPLALSTVWFASRARFGTHRRIARVTFPLWLYVSVTGVLIFFLLRGSPPAAP
jgi:putative membrane protein